MEKQSKLSAKERKALEQEQIAKNKKKAERKRLAGISAATAAAFLAIAGAGGYFLTKEGSETSTLPQTPSLSGKEAGKIVQKEINKMGIEGSQKEADLWADLLNQYPIEIPEDQTQREAATQEIVVQVIDAMQRSENPYFNQAIEIINNQIQERKLNFSLENLGEAYARTGVYVDQNNKLMWDISYNTDKILVDQSPVVLALVLTHESVHLEASVKLRASHPELSPIEFADFSEKIYDDTKIRLNEEALAYATAAQAFIYNAALNPMASSPDFTPLLDAANLIRCDMDIAGSCWEGYIDSNSKRILGSE